MRSRGLVRRVPITVPIAAALFLAALAGCENTPPAQDREPQDTRPVRPSVGPATVTPPPATAPVLATQPATVPTASQPIASTRAAPADPPLPDYVQILERFDPQDRASLETQTGAGNRLTLTTRNVRRIRIIRRDVPLAPQRTIALQLDGQGIEWRAGSDVNEFERSTNGEWAPIVAGRPAPSRP